MAVLEVDEISRPFPNVFSNLSVVSLVILFLRSLVITSPRGALFAKLFDDNGFEL